MEQSQSDGVRHTLAVLTYTRPDLAQSRIRDLTRLYGERPDVEILIIDNGSTDLDYALMFMTMDKTHPFRVVRIEPNRGFGGGWNEGLKQARGDILYLISDDVRVYGDIVGPIAARLGDRPARIIGQELLQSTGWNTFGGQAIPYLMGHFLVIPRSTWVVLGGFDAETFHPYDYEDLDLCYRATKLGFGLEGVPGLPIEHAVAQTIGYSDARMEHTIKMRAAFAAKHGLPNVPERP